MTQNGAKTIIEPMGKGGQNPLHHGRATQGHVAPCQFGAALCCLRLSKYATQPSGATLRQYEEQATKIHLAP